VVAGLRKHQNWKKLGLTTYLTPVTRGAPFHVDAEEAHVLQAIEDHSSAPVGATAIFCVQRQWWLSRVDWWDHIIAKLGFSILTDAVIIIWRAWLRSRCRPLTA
jgi:hypothetical protein